MVGKEAPSGGTIKEAQVGRLSSQSAHFRFSGTFIKSLSWRFSSSWEGMTAVCHWTFVTKKDVDSGVHNSLDISYAGLGIVSFWSEPSPVGRSIVFRGVLEKMPWGQSMIGKIDLLVGWGWDSAAQCQAIRKETSRPLVGVDVNRWILLCR